MLFRAGRDDEADLLAAASGAPQLRYQIVVHGTVIRPEPFPGHAEIDDGMVTAARIVAVGGNGVSAIDHVLNGAVGRSHDPEYQGVTDVPISSGSVDRIPR